MVLGFCLSVITAEGQWLNEFSAMGQNNNILTTDDPQPERAQTDITVFPEGLYNWETGLLCDSIWAMGKFSKNADNINQFQWLRPYQRDWMDVLSFDSLDIQTGVTPVAWVQLELRSREVDFKGMPRRFYHQEGIITTKGKILDVRGFPFSWNVVIGDYFIVVHTNNHLPIQSSHYVFFQRDRVTWDFTDSPAKTLGGKGAVKLLPGSVEKWGMRAGDLCPAQGFGLGHDGVVDLNDQMYIFYRYHFNYGHWAPDLNGNGKITPDDINMCAANWFDETFVQYWGPPWWKQPLGSDDPVPVITGYGYTLTADNFRTTPAPGVMNFQIHIQADVDSLYVGGIQLALRVNPDYFGGIGHIFAGLEPSPEPFIIDTTRINISNDEIRIIIFPMDPMVLYRISDSAPNLLVKIRLWTDLGAFQGSLNPSWKNSGNFHTQVIARKPDGGIPPFDVTDSSRHVIDFPTGITGVQDIIPVDYSLLQNFPNPFNPSTTISYSLPRNSNVELSVFDITGRQVMNLMNNEEKIPGNYSITFDGSNLSSGTYFYKLKTDEFTDVKKMVLIK